VVMAVGLLLLSLAIFGWSLTIGVVIGLSIGRRLAKRRAMCDAAAANTTTVTPAATAVAHGGYPGAVAASMASAAPAPAPLHVMSAMPIVIASPMYTGTSPSSPLPMVQATLVQPTYVEMQPVASMYPVLSGNGYGRVRDDEVV